VSASANGLIVDETAGSDQVRLLEGLGPNVDLNYDGKVDPRMTTVNSVVQVNAGLGNDLVDGLSLSTHQTVQLGEGATTCWSAARRATCSTAAPTTTTCSPRTA